MGNKLTYEFVKESFKAEGYELLSKEYKGAHQKLDYICPKGYRHSIRWYSWQQGKRYPEHAKNKKLTYEFVKESFEAEGYTLLTEEYRNNRQRLEYICPRQRKGRTTWSRWHSGKRCICCSKVCKKTIEFVRSEFKKEGYILLTEKYINSGQKLDYICPEGHRHSVRWGDWQQGVRCPHRYGLAKLTFDFVRLEFEKRGYILLSTEYINARSNLKFRCGRGHIGEMTWGNFNNGCICLQCSRENNAGSKHCNWRGGISKDPYCFDWTKDLKELIKERDSYKCSNPYCSSKNPEDLTVHHINYNKKSCGPENLITVCRSCNSRANSDRNWHKAWYQAILNRRYGYIFNN